MFDYLSQLFAEPIAFFDQAIFRVLAVLIGLCCHEWGHAYAAYRCGDSTAKCMGRMTLNPLAHLDPVGTLLMFFVGFGYAKPVPVNPWNFKGDRRKCDLAVSLAGITVNIVLFVLFTFGAAALSLMMWSSEVIEYYGLSTLLSYRYNAVWSVIEGSVMREFGPLIAVPALVPLVHLCAYTALVNLNLAVFNLIPLPPLDGYHVFNDLILKGKLFLSEKAFRIGMMIVLILSAQGMLGKLISAVVFPAQNLLLLPIRMIWG
ncbi:MAG: site-2 protease family protein [Clostridia bacterium]|nr:site-2 protease family protein [Clostridia bacterium]